MKSRSKVFSDLYATDKPQVLTAGEPGPDIAPALEIPPAPNVIAEVGHYIRRYAILLEVAYLPLATWTVTCICPNGT